MWRRRLVAARCCRSSRIRTGVLRSGGGEAGWTGVYVGWNGACVAAGAASKREADVDNSAVSSRGKDSTHLPLEVHKLRAARPQQSRLTGRLHGPVCLTGALPPTACCRTATADPHNFDYKPAANPTSRTLPPLKGAR